MLAGMDTRDHRRRRDRARPPAPAGAWARSTNRRRSSRSEAGRCWPWPPPPRPHLRSRSSSLVVVVPAGWEDYAEGAWSSADGPATVVTGGDSRQASVRARARRCSTDVAGRRDPRRGPAVRLARSVHRRDRCGRRGRRAGVIPVIPVADTVKRVRRRDGRRHARPRGAGAGADAAGVRGRRCSAPPTTARPRPGWRSPTTPRRWSMAGHQVRAVPGRPDEHEDHHPVRPGTGRSPHGRRSDG